MKLIKKYFLAFILLAAGAFVFSNNCVLAENQENPSQEEEVIDPNFDGEDFYAVLNPNSLGEPNHKYDNVQYTKARDISIKIDFDKLVEVDGIDLDKIDRNFEICEYVLIKTENNKQEKQYCSTYLILEDEYNFQIPGMGDGEKTIKIYIHSLGNQQGSLKTITKKIVLDTTAPVITLKEGAYIFLSKGQKYVEPGATCEDDSGLITGECNVAIQDVEIDMHSKDYQYIRYTAKDFLGNETNAVRVIMIEVPEKDTDYTFWIFAGIGIAILAAFLFLQAWKNKEKQKNQSVL